MNLRQEQRLALLPQMLQSIEVLQLATGDLLQLIDAELERNEALELVPTATELPAPPPEPVAAREDTGWDEPVAAAGGGDDGEDRKRAFLENQPDAAPSLEEFVRLQIAWLELPAQLATAVLQLVDHLDERGLLPLTTAEVAARTGVPAELLDEARAVLLTLEPRGLGAATPVEAMLAQAAGDPDLPLIAEILHAHLDALARNKLPDVARALAVSVEDLQALLSRMRTLAPRPAAMFAGEVARGIRPDAHAWLRDGEVQVALDDRCLPALGVVSEYESLARDRQTDPQVRRYLRDKVRSARGFIGAITQRQDTLLRVVAAVMQEQRTFLAQGRTGIRPLRMAEIADRLGLHTSTVSRAIAGKHVQTDRGVFRLRDFFDGGRSEGPPVAGQGRSAIAERIAELVAAEDRRAPLSDDDLVAALATRGIAVARRTVTKYRKELGIAASYQRKQHGSTA